MNSTTKVYVMNSAMMPIDAMYVRSEITKEEFIKILQTAETIQSSIGYPEVASHIQSISGIVVPVDRGITKLEEENGIILVCRLKFRPEAFEKGKIKALPNDYEYLKVEFTKKVKINVNAIL